MVATVDEDREASVAPVHRTVLGPGEVLEASADILIREEPLEIRVNGFSVAVVMRTPSDDDALVRGFLLTERIVRNGHQIQRVGPCRVVTAPESEGNVYLATLTAGTAFDVSRFRRNMFASSSCGICGKASVEQALDPAEPLEPPPAPIFEPSELLELVPTMRRSQALFDLTGGVHAAAGFTERGQLLNVHEDVGRHNAVDKVVGNAFRDGYQPAALAVSGRVSFEIVQKAAAARIPTIVAVSAPSSLAVELARASQMTLVAFARGDRMVIYADAGRIRVDEPRKPAYDSV